MKDNITCPSCGNVQPAGTEKCYKCGFRLNAYMDYLEAVDSEVNRPTSARNRKNKNFYEISPQWQQYVDRQQTKTKSGGRFKRLITDPRFIIGFIVIGLALGSFIKYAIDSGMFKKSNTTDNSKSVTQKVDNSQKYSPSSQNGNSNSITSTPKAETSKLPLEVQNAYESAKDYLDFMAFSKSGLIKQLTLEGYSKESATEAVELLNANWNKQAARSAKGYLEYMTLSRKELINQLKIEGFTDEQAEYGAKAVGYDDASENNKTGGKMVCVGQYIDDDGFRVHYVSSAYDDNDTRRTMNGIKEGYDVIRLNLFAENLTDYVQSFSDLNFRCYADDYTCSQLFFGTGSFSYDVKPGNWAKGSVFFSVPSGSKVIEVEYAPTLYGEAVSKLAFEGDKDSGLNYDDKIILNKTPMRVGESIEAEDVQITYLKSGDYDAKNDWFLGEDMKVIYIEVEIENVSDDNISVSDEWFDCYADGNSCTGYSIENELFALVTPGRKIKGNVAFKVPKKAEEIIIKYEYEPSNFIQISYQ